MLKEYVLACMHTLTYTLFAATSQKYFSLTPNQYQPAVFFYHNKSASATAQRTEAIIYHTTHLSQFLYSRANCSAFWNPEGFFPRCNQSLSWTRTLHSRTMLEFLYSEWALWLKNTGALFCKRWVGVQCVKRRDSNRRASQGMCRAVHCWGTCSTVPVGRRALGTRPFRLVPEAAHRHRVG